MFDDISYEDKFFVWARKIEQQVFYYEDNNFDKDIIVEYLEKCSILREKLLNPDDLTDIEEDYTEEINDHTFEKYGVSDYIFEKRFGN